MLFECLASIVADVAKRHICYYWSS